jgi:hypothetical protein
MYRSSREGFDRLLLFSIDCLYMRVNVLSVKNLSPVCRDLVLYRIIFAPLNCWAVSVAIFETRHYDILYRACAFMTRYVVHEYSWHAISRLDRRDG